MQLIIAEKPILGKAIADALPGIGKTENGCIYKSDYVITWVFGHMLALKEPEDYDEGYKEWNTKVLPIYFPDWGLKIGKDTGSGTMTKKQRVNQIGSLLKSADLVIHAGDPDDEGQLLIDELLRWFNYKGPVKRLDTANTTLAAMKKALKNLSDNKSYEVYGWSAYARSVADLMVGINMSRLFTCKNNTLLTIGRVQTPTLGLVVARDYLIENHIKQVYYNILCDVEIDNKHIPAKFMPSKTDNNLTDGKILSKDYAENISKRIKNKTYNNISVTKKIEYEEPPLPFNLVKLQTYCSSHFGYDPQKVLNITQSLRENHKAITYNRSDCQYLSDEHFKEAPGVLKQVFENIHFKPAQLNVKNKSKCFDNSKISAHFAIIPTDEKVNLAKLTQEEKDVYLAVCKYYIAQFLPKAEKEKTNMSIDIGNGEYIKAVSTIILKPGYRAIFKEAEKDNVSELSDLISGVYTGLVTDAKTEEKETKPPARYTKASLNEDMTCISKYVTDKHIKELLLSKDKDKEGEKGSIGTSATRSGIIENLIKRGFIEENGKKIISTPLGRELYRILPDEIKKADMTAEWWQIQEQIQKGEKVYTELIKSVLDTITGIVAHANNYPMINNNIIPRKQNGYTEVGKCPWCGGNIIEGKLNFYCGNWKNNNCKFTIWKKSKSPLFAKVNITSAIVKKLLEGKEVESKRLMSKKGTMFTAKFKLSNEKSPYGACFDLVFDNKKKSG